VPWNFLLLWSLFEKEMGSGSKCHSVLWVMLHLFTELLICVEPVLLCVESVFCVTRFSFWFLLDLPDACRCLLLVFLIVSDSLPPRSFNHHTHIECHTLQPTLLLFFQNEHLHSGAVRWPLIHLVGLFIVCNSCSTYIFTMLVLELSGRTFTV